ncbi:MAG: response regulator [Elusimicrobia bacterium]|nr:response regulator [Candidatus Obscuribacterium magneticum]
MSDSSMNPKRILVVDDDADILNLWIRILKKEGFDVVTAISGEEAVKRLNNDNFGVVFSDINMPGMSGKDLLKYVKQNHSASCVNMITGLATVEGAVECMHLGACDYIAKPCEKQELVAMAFRCLRHYDHQLESRRLQETVFRLEEIDKLKSEFVSNVSHELRTPLFSLGAALELLLQDKSRSMDETSIKLCNVIWGNFERLRRLVSNILNFSRLENGTLRLNYQDVDLSTLVNRIFTELSPLFLQRKIRFDVVTNPAPFVTMTTDPEQIQHVLINLLGNAIKFTPEGGKVGVRLDEEGDRIRICVWDTGSGIDSKNQERIFDRFYQVDGSMTREAGGTGIGLSIVKAVVDMHGGKVWVESELDKGSRFYISLPKHQIKKETTIP